MNGSPLGGTGPSVTAAILVSPTMAWIKRNADVSDLRTLPSRPLSLIETNGTDADFHLSTVPAVIAPSSGGTGAREEGGALAHFGRQEFIPGEPIK